MVPRDQFNKMAALALVAIIMLALLSFKAFAAEVDYIDSGPPPEQGGSTNLLTEVTSIRRSLDLILYFVIPFAFVFFLVWKFCVWFYDTFVRGVL